MGNILTMETFFGMRLNKKTIKNKRRFYVEPSFCRDDWIRTSDHTPPRRVL